MFPRPVAGLLRPVVRGQTLRYNSKRRLGRGFTHEELKVRRRHKRSPPPRTAPPVSRCIMPRTRDCQCANSSMVRVDEKALQRGGNPAARAAHRLRHVARSSWDQ